ncbi:DUF397 domain-containing protein [Actinacidiphila rubida]|uniref:DUF397 domain-containing protein n=1 Tax=Actinacidiphila rubida TaxID=310780 RepID=A0A1H8MNC3_9ACTN|nr:DUF397 domain-containing protein [Actinacidiphila rubida]SEO18819.1 protein of unknown function [Actinacidiphila rubida]
MTSKPSAGMSAAGPNWFKSSYSTAEGPDCVEVAACPEAVHVRDSKDPQGPRLTFAPTEWTAFLAYAADRV